MSTIRLRPTFRLTSSQTGLETLNRVRAAMQNHEKTIEGQFKPGHGVISIVGPERHFWSPWLNLEFREEGDECEVHGRFSPHPSIWTAFAFSYIAIGVLIFFTTIAGMAQQLAGQSPIAYYSLPVWVAIAFGLWVASQIGQRLAQEQMVLLKQVVVESVRLSETKFS